MNTHTNLSLNFTLLKGAEVFAPAALGVKDILICQDKIVLIEDNICPDTIPNCTVFSLNGQKICPGIIDQHIHLIGGGGEAGAYSRTPEARFSDLVEAAITTAVGLLGTDGITRHPETLLAKVKALNYEGITAYMLTGAYSVPTPTITGDIQKDIVFIEPIIGVKTAISDHRASAPTIQELCKIASSARVGGLLSAKAGLTVFHLGNSPKALAPLYEVIAHSDVPINKLLPTHVNRTELLFNDAIRFAKQGGYIDLTSGINPDMGARSAVKPSKAIVRALNEGVPLAQITISSDGNGSMPVFDKTGQLTGITVAGFSSLMKEIRDLVLIENLSLADALQPVTSSVAKLLHIQKGSIQSGFDADLMVLNSDLLIQSVFAKGRQVVKEGKACKKGTFE